MNYTISTLNNKQCSQVHVIVNSKYYHTLIKHMVSARIIITSTQVRIACKCLIHRSKTICCATNVLIQRLCYMIVSYTQTNCGLCIVNTGLHYFYFT